MLKKLKTFPVLFLFSFFQLAGAQSDISTITVKEESVSSLLEASGFFEVPLQELPVSASVISSEDIEKNNIHRLSDVTSLDASTTDSYNATGYWDSLTVRGYLLDNRYSFQREGLPISAETSLPLDNKERVEILKGISGVQNGVSSPGGLVNYVIKRPLEIRQVRTELRDRGNFLIAADVGGQSNKVSRLGYRLNIAHENLRPLVNQATGERFFLSLANDLELSENSLLETDIEWSRQAQSSQAGMRGPLMLLEQRMKELLCNFLLKTSWIESTGASPRPNMGIFIFTRAQKEDCSSVRRPLFKEVCKKV